MTCAYSYLAIYLSTATASGLEGLGGAGRLGLVVDAGRLAAGVEGRLEDDGAHHLIHGHRGHGQGAEPGPEGGKLGLDVGGNAQGQAGLGDEARPAPLAQRRGVARVATG